MSKLTTSSTDVAAYDITGFCVAHNISRSYYYMLCDQGKGPEEMRLGRRRLISREAATEWRQKLTQAQTAKA